MKGGETSPSTPPFSANGNCQRKMLTKEKWTFRNRWRSRKRIMKPRRDPLCRSVQRPMFGQIRIPLIRRIYPSLIANDIVKVQPLSSPTGLVYYLRYRYSGDREIVTDNPDPSFSDLSTVHIPADRTHYAPSNQTQRPERISPLMHVPQEACNFPIQGIQSCPESCF